MARRFDQIWLVLADAAPLPRAQVDRSRMLVDSCGAFLLEDELDHRRGRASRRAALPDTMAADRDHHQANVSEVHPAKRGFPVVVDLDLVGAGQLAPLAAALEPGRGLRAEVHQAQLPLLRALITDGVSGCP